jgi:hypothetical protein
MNEEIGAVFFLLPIGAFVVARTVWSLWTGKSYISKPATLVTRTSDPFSYWLTVGPLCALSLVLVGGSLFMLLRQISN